MGGAKDGNICGARRRDGLFCTKPAGWGTHHVGVGRCRLHGGAKTGTPKQLVVYCDPLLAPRANELLQDPDILNCRAELAVLKARFETIKAQPDFSDIKLLTSLSRAIGSLATQIHQMEMGRHHYIHISVTGTIINKFTEIGMRYIPDPRLRAQFAEEVERAIRHSIKASGARAIAARALTPLRDDAIIDVEFLSPEDDRTGELTSDAKTGLDSEGE